MPEKLLIYCSFCGKSQEDVMHLVTGPSVAICDECIDLAAGIVNDARKAAEAPAEQPGGAQEPY